MHTQNKSFYLSLKKKEHSHGTVLNQLKKLTLPTTFSYQTETTKKEGEFM